MGRKGKSLDDPNVDKVEVYRAYTTHSPIEMPNRRISRGMVSGDNGTDKKAILSAFRKSAEGNPPLRAHGIPVPIILKDESISHDIKQNQMSKQKLAIITDYERLDQLLWGGTVIEERIHLTNRFGKLSKKKKNWERLWAVRGSVNIGKKLHSFDIRVVQIKNEQKAYIYSFDLRRRKK